MSNRDEQIVIIPAETRYYAMLFRDVADAYTPQVGVSAMWVYTRFLMEMNFTTKFSPPLSYTRLAKLCCMDRSTVILKVQDLIDAKLLKIVPQETIEELQAKGVIRNDENLEGCNIYQVIDPFYVRHPDAPVLRETLEKEVVGKSDQGENPPSRKIPIVGKSPLEVGKSDQGVVGKSDTYVNRIRSKRSKPKDTASAVSTASHATHAPAAITVSQDDAEKSSSRGRTPKPKELLPQDSDAVKLAMWFRDKLVKIHPEAVAPEGEWDGKDIQKWAAEFAAMLKKLDKINICKAINNAYADSWWCDKIMSPRDLSKNDYSNYNRCLVLQPNNKSKSTTGPFGKPANVSGHLLMLDRTEEQYGERRKVLN